MRYKTCWDFRADLWYNTSCMAKKKLILFFLILVATLSFLVYQKAVAANAPALKEGSYLTGQTLSTWPSWSTLGNVLGVSLPMDPINQLAAAGTCAINTNRFCIEDRTCESPVTSSSQKCVLHDPVTGWSVVDRRFTFACSRDSYAYRYIASTTPGAYTVRAHFEDPGISPLNFNSFVSSFVSTSIFKINDSSGVCNQDPEISSMQSGACGDGKLNLNKGEQCDPPGRIEYANGCDGSTKHLTVCSSGCLWTQSTTPCGNLSRCGNGSVEFGEACDDGALNGKYNKCNIACTGKSSEYCGDALLQSAYEVCDPGAVVSGGDKYALARNNSCRWDCQNFGPYCGDSLVQTQFGEECDGSQSCSVDGSPGVKACTSSCLKTDRDAVAWWRFEQFIAPTQNTTADASVNGNTATCNLAAGTCPKAGLGKYGHDFTFTPYSSEPRFFTVAHSASLTPTTSLTVEAWIFPISTTTLYQRIIEKGGYSTGAGYDLEFNVSATTSAVRFNLWKSVQTSVDSRSAIAKDTWTHVVGTYQRSGTTNIAKIYINGVLENTISVDSVNPIMAVPSTGNLTIGKSAGTAVNDLFFGSLDEIKIYNRVLSADQVRNNYQTGWFCVATSTVLTATAPGTCGDNVINTNEECDRGATNNGRACTPTYGMPCSYCSANCQNTIDVQPAQYCGNGFIESSERCEVSAGIIYSGVSTTGWTLPTKDIIHNGFQELACANETTDAHTIKKGAKTCADCAAGVVRNCVKCGFDVNGVVVEGSVMNVLDNPLKDQIADTTPDPLFARNFTSGSSLSLAIGQAHSILAGRAVKNNSSPELVSYTLLNPYGAGNALISSDPSCSVDDNPANKYQMFVNFDWTRPLNFSVVADPKSWQYDMVLSPVVSAVSRAKDLRIVVSWVGAGDFYSGVLNPFDTATPQSSQLEGPSYAFNSCPPSGICKFVYQYATGTTYYDASASFKKSGVWYHGFNSTPGQTSAEAFTIDTSAMSGNTYSFYVRAPSYPIRTFKNTAKLKVDVYLPEANSNPYQFGTPVKTYYFLSASPSDNQNARYWQVFNINEPSSGVTATDIIDINAIVTGPTYFQYTNPLIARPICTDADWTGYDSAIACEAPDTHILTWTKKPTSNCVEGVQHPATETVTCAPAPINVGTPSACTEADWSFTLPPVMCPSSGKQIKTWTKITNCTGGVVHPATEQVYCTPGTYSM